jgi:hypothetical protein
VWAFRVYPHPKGKTLKNARFINEIGELKNLTPHICLPACAGLPRPRVGPRREFHTPRNCSTQHPSWASKCRLFVVVSFLKAARLAGNATYSDIFMREYVACDIFSFASPASTIFSNRWGTIGLVLHFLERAGRKSSNG